jgi:hypothetical protein
MYTNSTPRRIRYKNFHRKDPTYKKSLFEGANSEASGRIQEKIIGPYLFLERNPQFQLLDEVDIHPGFDRMWIRIWDLQRFQILDRKQNKNKGLI